MLETFCKTRQVIEVEEKPAAYVRLWGLDVVEISQPTDSQPFCLCVLHEDCGIDPDVVQTGFSSTADAQAALDFAEKIVRRVVERIAEAGAYCLDVVDCKQGTIAADDAAQGIIDAFKNCLDVIPANVHDRPAQC